jgi:vacuolar-type H+-ATPase subunit I/STV1
MFGKIIKIILPVAGFAIFAKAAFEFKQEREAQYFADRALDSRITELTSEFQRVESGRGLDQDNLTAWKLELEHYATENFEDLKISTAVAVKQAQAEVRKATKLHKEVSENLVEKYNDNLRLVNAHETALRDVYKTLKNQQDHLSLLTERLEKIEKFDRDAFLEIFSEARKKIEQLDKEMDRVRAEPQNENTPPENSQE